MQARAPFLCRPPACYPSHGQYLEENDLLIAAIKQNQNLGRLHECVQYQLQLQQNLVHLAMHADEQPGIVPLRLKPQIAAPAAEAPASSTAEAPASASSADGHTMSPSEDEGAAAR
jgi:hypothetical protein